MIPVTPLEGRSVLLSVRSIEQIEETPETVLVLTGGRRMVVVDVAQDLVNRINRIHARVVAAAAAPRRLRCDPGEPEPVALAGPTHRPFPAPEPPTVSSVNLLHIGQATMDRILASLARCRWDQSTARTPRMRLELAEALDGIGELARVLDHEHPGTVTRSVTGILADCTERLTWLYGQTAGTVSPQEADLVVRSVHVSLIKLRKVWAQVAADTSWHSRTLPDRSAATPIPEPAR